MDDSQPSIEELLRMAEAAANSGEPPGRSAHRVPNDKAQEMISKGYTDIHDMWFPVMNLVDPGLANAIGQIWVPDNMLDINLPPSDSDEYACIVSSRQWFDEDKLSHDESKALYGVVNAVVSIHRFMTEKGMNDDDADG